MPKGRELLRLQPRITHISDALIRVVVSGQIAPDLREWSELDWKLARVVANLQGILAHLHTRCAKTPFGPPDWQAFLAEQHRLNTLRIGKLLGIYNALAREMNTREVHAMPLKGCDLLTRVYDDPSPRPTSDIDVLVRPDQFERATEAVLAAGFIAAGGIKRHDVFVWPPETVVSKIGEHPDNPIRVELHPAVDGMLSRTPYDLTQAMWASSSTHEHNGVRDQRPDLAHLALHVLIHAACDMQPRAFRFSRVIDMRTLFARFSKTDWQALQSAIEREKGHWWAYPPCALLARHYPNALPPEFLAGLRQRCPLSLRLLMRDADATYLSYCNLRMATMGDIAAWARTPWRAVDHAISMTLPSKEERAAWTLSTRPAGPNQNWRKHFNRVRRVLGIGQMRTLGEMMFSQIEEET
jgi:hypothetical protein